MLAEAWEWSEYPSDDGQVSGQNEKYLDNGLLVAINGNVKLTSAIVWSSLENMLSRKSWV